MERILTYGQLREIKGLTYCRTHLRRMYDPRGEWYAGFPQPIQIGPARIGWWESEVDEWLRTRPRKELPPQAPDEELE